MAIRLGGMVDVKELFLIQKGSEHEGTLSVCAEAIIIAVTIYDKTVGR